MKKVLIVGVIASALIGPQLGVVEADWGDGPGCGLGKMLFENQPKSILLQHLGSTSNVPSQPFAISSGTSGCTNNGMLVKNEQTFMFVSANAANVTQEMARGRGEYLESLASLLGVPQDRQTEFFALAQDIYLNMMQEQEKNVEAVEAEVAPRAVLIALQEGMRTHSIPSKVSLNR